MVRVSKFFPVALIGVGALLGACSSHQDAEQLPSRPALPAVQPSSLSGDRAGSGVSASSVRARHRQGAEYRRQHAAHSDPSH